MTLAGFIASLNREAPPQDLSPLLQALWWDAKGDWTRAHEITQEIESPDAAWVHAYLHRKEGDIWNAGYWYRRAGKQESSHDLNTELQEIVEQLLARKSQE
ncbi:MAG TPA: hypothetical protein VHB45_14905 [Alloacidobacterium sp.]|nr:hypothetical protein [Alloacidobacterium sp.]